MKLFILWCAVIAAVSCTDGGGEQAHNLRDLLKKVVKKYEGEEGVQRLMKRSSESVKATLKEFKEFVEMADEINADPSKPYSAEYNKVSVMSKAQKAALSGVNATLIDREILLQERDGYETDMRRVKRQSAEPSKLCWVHRGAQPAIKNQGGCGSCWAFGAVSALEANYHILTGDKKTFAEQEYLDCVYEGSRNGCQGGWMMTSYSYNKAKDRMAELKDAPYKAVDGVCSYGNVPNGLTKAKVTGYKFVRGNDATMQTAINSGVVTVAIKVVTSFHSYRTGVYVCTTSDCNQSINHAVTVVGYGVTNAGLKYWNVRNSWGTNWGDGGYIKMTRDDTNKNIINIHSYSQVPTLECRSGQTCTTPNWDDDDDDDDDKDDGETDKGKDVQCGNIVHSGGRCLSIDDSADKYVDLSNVCERTWCLTDKGYLYETATDMCANVAAGTDDEKLKLGETCKTKWEKTSSDGFKNKADGRCMHPSGGSNNPPESANVVAYTGCNEDRLQFKFSAQICWELEAGKKLKGKVAGAKAVKKLDAAKEACMENKKCAGINYIAKKKKYILRSKEKMVKSKKAGDKCLLMVKCDKACNKGEERCDDGDCKSACEDDDSDDGDDDSDDGDDDSDDGDDDNGGCPSGTKLCDDGVCRHEHMCH